MLLKLYRKNLIILVIWLLWEKKKINENFFKSGIDLSSVLRENISLFENFGLYIVLIGIVCVFILWSLGCCVFCGELEMLWYVSYVIFLY